MSFADRAVQFRERRQPLPQPTTIHRELSELSEESPPASDADETPLDDAIAADVAARYTVEAIRRRIARCQAYAALPNARPSDVEAVNDWRRILAAKVAGREAS